MSGSATIHDLSGDPVQRAREDLAAAYRLCVRFGFNEGIDNHLSLAVPGEDDRFLIIPYGLHWSEVTASNLVVVDGEGTVTEGDGFIEPTAFFIHAAIHKARPDAQCVMHTHMPNALALTMIEDGRLEMADQNAIRYCGRIAYDDTYGGLALDWDEADRIAAAMGDKDILFMANHGVTVARHSVAAAWEDLYYLEQACRAQILAMSTGRPLKKISDNMAADVAAGIRAESLGRSANFDRHLEALKRVLDREGADFRD
jgi:ribulose-5-phosphate 4-epimerase/fuculose-1-phosphate aldolase